MCFSMCLSIHVYKQRNVSDTLGPFWQSASVCVFTQIPSKGTKHLSGMFKSSRATDVENKDWNFPWKKSHSTIIVNMFWRLMYLWELAVQLEYTMYLQTAALHRPNLILKIIYICIYVCMSFYQGIIKTESSARRPGSSQTSKHGRPLVLWITLHFFYLNACQEKTNSVVKRDLSIDLISMQKQGTWPFLERSL